MIRHIPCSFNMLLLAFFISTCDSPISNDHREINSLDIPTIRDEFDIPYLDLAFDTSRQMVVDREAGIYFGHPTTVTINENQTETILAAYPLGGHGKGITTIRSTKDGGRTWSERYPGATRLGRVEEVPTIHKVYDVSGQERLIMFTGLYPARMAVSEDKGHSWLPYQALGDWGGIVVMGDLIPIKNHPQDKEFAPGKYMAFFHDDGRFISGSNEVYRDPEKFVLYKTTSVDGGLSWSFPETIWEDSLRFICEPGLVRSPDGTELAMLLRENSRRYNSQIMLSRDEGKTWTAPKPLPRELCGDRHVIRYHSDGRLVIVFRDRQRRTAKGPTEGDYVAWVGTYEDLTSGKVGQYRVRLLKNYQEYDCGYSGLELLQDGSFLATTYLQYRIKDDGNNSVVAVKFSLEELDRALNSFPIQ
jgi:hypothetical protein